MFPLGGLAIIFKRGVLGGLDALSGFVGESQQIERFRVSLLGEGFRELDALGVAAGLEGLHGFLRRSFDFGRQGRGVVAGERNSGLQGSGKDQCREKQGNWTITHADT